MSIDSIYTGMNWIYFFSIIFSRAFKRYRCVWNGLPFISITICVCAKMYFCFWLLWITNNTEKNCGNFHFYLILLLWKRLALSHMWFWVNSPVRVAIYQWKRIHFSQLRVDVFACVHACVSEWSTLNWRLNVGGCYSEPSYSWFNQYYRDVWLFIQKPITKLCLDR